MPKPKPQPKRPTRAATKKPVPKVTHKKELSARERFYAENPTWQEQFLTLFGNTLNIASSAMGAGINRRTVYRERDRNPGFAAALADAKAEAIERLEGAAYERAKKMSDVLLIFLLKAHKPEVYRENMNVHHSGAVNLTFTELAKLASNE